MRGKKRRYSHKQPKHAIIPFKYRKITKGNNIPVLKYNRKFSSNEVFHVGNESRVPLPTPAHVFNHPVSKEDEIDFTFSSEIKHIIDTILSPDDDAEIMTKMVVGDLNKVVQRLNKSYYVVPFGSHISGLACEDSDFDFYLKDSRSNRGLGEDKHLLNEVARMLNKNGNFREIIKIPSARVPIVKMVHKLTKKQCDLSFSSEIGVCNSFLVKYYVSMNENLKPLVIFLKFLLRKYELHGPQKITTYMLFWLVVYYLQQNDILPPINIIRKEVDAPYFVNGWDCRVPKNFETPMTDPASLFIHVKSFFKYYVDFEFSTQVISPYLACSIPVEKFEACELPFTEFKQYIDKVGLGEATTFSCSTMNLQDATEHNINITKQVTLESMNHFKSFCYLFHDFFKGLVEPTLILNDILPKSILMKEPPADCMQYFRLSITSSRLPDGHGIKNTFQTRAVTYVFELLSNLMKTKFDCNVVEKVLNSVRRITRKKEGLSESVVKMSYLHCTSNSESWIDVIGVRNNKKLEPSDVVLTAFYVIDMSPSGNEIRISVESKAVFIRYLSYNLLKLILYPNASC